MGSTKLSAKHMILAIIGQDNELVRYAAMQYLMNEQHVRTGCCNYNSALIALHKRWYPRLIKLMSAADASGICLLAAAKLSKYVPPWYVGLSSISSDELMLLKADLHKEVTTC